MQKYVRLCIQRRYASSRTIMSLTSAFLKKISYQLGLRSECPVLLEIVIFQNFQVQID